MDINEIRHANIRFDEKGIYKCNGDHDKSEPCQYDLLTNEEVFNLIQDLRAMAVVLVEKMKSVDG